MFFFMFNMGGDPQTFVARGPHGDAVFGFGQALFACYMVWQRLPLVDHEFMRSRQITVVVLTLNLLIAAFNQTYSAVSDNLDQEWKYLRAQLLQQFEDMPCLCFCCGRGLHTF